MILCSHAGVNEVDGDVCGSRLDVLVPAVLHVPAAGQRHLHALPVHQRGGQEVGAGVQRPLPSLRLPAAVFCLHHHLLLLHQHPCQQRWLAVLLCGEEGSCGNPMGLSSSGGGMEGYGGQWKRLSKIHGGRRGGNLLLLVDIILPGCYTFKTETKVTSVSYKPDPKMSFFVTEPEVCA